MNKKNIFLICVVLLLFGLYVVYFTDLFKPRIVHVSSISRTGTVRFKFEDGEYKIKELKVVVLSAFETNKYILPVWALISDSNSVPTSGFVYGNHIPGMKSGMSGGRTKPLETNTVYRLLVTTTKGVAHTDFQYRTR